MNTVQNQEVRDKLTTARVRMMFKVPFFGNLVTRMQLIEDYSIPTAATNGRDMFYNPDFIDSFDRSGYIAFLLGHEVLHMVYEHVGRRLDRDKELWNIAIDYVVNGILVEQKIGTLIPNCYYDDKYKGMSANAIYDILLAEREDGQDPSSGGKSIDVHLDDPDPDSNASGNKKSEDGTGQSAQPLSPEELEDAQTAMKAVLIDLATSMAGSGQVPPDISRLVGDLTDPVMDWRELINASITSHRKDDYTFSRPNKRSQFFGAVLPGFSTLNDAIDVAVAIDYSGSISKTMVRDFVSEVKGIMQTFDSFKLRLWTFDTSVSGYAEFDEYNIDEIDTWSSNGGGGTEFMVNWNFMVENDIEPEQFIMFTDGYPWNSWGDEDYVDTIFVIHGNDKIKAPFGMTAYYEK